ncbi:MAG TPA: putative sulfate exporter family transporter, partial [Sphingopyxis sp.]|nr:putative sulfate exporter family transporter [Sphingopyxis sp.]
MSTFAARAAAPAPGVAVALMVAATATFLSDHYDAPVMLYALLLGMALNFVTDAPRGRAGIDFASKGLLRIGVALLGLRIGWDQISALGWEPVAMVVALVAATILISIFAARAMGFNPLFGFLSGGATAICGASAAMALSAALPPNARKEQATLFTVIGVSALSTAAMVLYPPVARLAGLDDHAAGVFIGATIHDVAQVVGAGYAISPDAGDTATIVKLLRVAMLLPVILIAGQISRRAAGAAG